MTRAHTLELLLLTLLAAGASAAVPLSSGQMLWSWDALNHHVYLGLIATHPRWELDVIAASYQGYQYPYLYWPVYLMSQLNGSGAVVGACWSGLQAALLLPPVWLICLRVLPAPGSMLQGVGERLAGCVLAFSSVIILVGLETTSNDLMASLPLLWAVAVSLGAPASDRRVMTCAGLWGMATAFKLSNGIYLPLLLLWWWTPARPYFPPRRALVLALGASLGFTLTYLPWGWQLWQLTGNPFHPYFAGQFGAS